MPRSMRALRGWRRLVPQKTRRPLPWSIVCAIAMHLALAGGAGMALCWLLMVDCYLRPGEAVALECSQVLPGTRVRHMRHTVLLLHPDERGIASKTGEYKTRAQAHRCERELVGTLRRLFGALFAKARRER